MILSLITGGMFLPLDFALSQSHTVEFSDWIQSWGNPAGDISFMEGSVNLPRYGRYEVSTYYNANSGQGQLYEEYKVLVDGNYIGQTSDPNSTPNGPDYETEYFGERSFTAGNHQVRLEHLWNYSEVGSQVLQEVLERLDKAYKAFFRRIKGKEKAGFPRFRGRDRYDSFTLKQVGWKLDGKHLSPGRGS